MDLKGINEEKRQYRRKKKERRRIFEILFLNFTNELKVILQGCYMLLYRAKITSFFLAQRILAIARIQFATMKLH